MEYLVLLFCFAITLHNLEEAIWLPRWSQQPSKFQKAVTANEFHFAVIVITGLAYLSAFYFLIDPSSTLARWILVGFLGSMIVNAVFPHLMATIIMKKYAPGLITGIMLNIPINTTIIFRMIKNQQLTYTELVLCTTVIGIILLTMIPILFKIGKKIAPSEAL